MNYDLCNHLFGEGLFHAEARLSPTADYDAQHVAPFPQLYTMLTALRKRYLRPCIDWVDARTATGGGKSTSCGCRCWARATRR